MVGGADALAEIAFPLQRRGHGHVMRGVRHQLLLPFLAPEEEQLVANVPFPYGYGTAEGITGIVVAKQRLGRHGQPELGPDVVQEGIRLWILRRCRPGIRHSRSRLLWSERYHVPR